MTELENQILKEQEALTKKAEGVETKEKDRLLTKKEVEEAENFRQESAKQTELEQMIIDDLTKKELRPQRSYSLNNLLKAEDIEAIQESWKQVNVEEFGVQIFRNLFALNPSLTDLFSFGDHKKLN